MSKIDKLNELNELFKGGVIDEDEFKKLKEEIISEKPAEIIKEREKKVVVHEEKVAVSKVSKGKQVFLKSFTDTSGKRVLAPDYKSLEFENLSSDEIKNLKPFLRKKHIHVPEEMTQDEIELGNRLFSLQEIAKMESERPGFNHAFAAIISLLAAATAAYFLYISPCLIIFCSSGLAASIFIALFTLSRANATKMDRLVSGIALALGVVALVFYFTGWQ